MMLSKEPSFLGHVFQIFNESEIALYFNFSASSDLLATKLSSFFMTSSGP